LINIVENNTKSKIELVGDEALKDQAHLIASEKAQILINIFGRKYSVIYDLATITDMIQ
jgi:hypothetical protein